MGLFSKLGGGEVTLTAQGGLLLAAFAMTAIDGEVDDDELAIIRRLDGSGATADWDAALKAWKANSIDDCVKLAAAAMDSGQQHIAMANLVDIAMADGVLGNNERLLLEAFATAFDVDEAAIEKIVDVIAIKNNKSAFA